MTTTPSTSNEGSFTKEWHPINVLTKVVCRQLTEDTFQLKSPSHVVTVSREGFDLYRKSIRKFEAWLDEHNIPSIALTDENREEFS